MAEKITLKTGDRSDNGQITIVDEDRLCYIVQSDSKGAVGIRTISKKLLDEFVDYVRNNPNTSSIEAREALSGKSNIDKFEYGYCATLVTMAKMVLGVNAVVSPTKRTSPNTEKISSHSLPFLAALRTKPFLLLAGISGTGKSQVRPAVSGKWFRPLDAPQAR